MFCKKCGRLLESRSGSCPYCGAKITYEGGNGFGADGGMPAPDNTEVLGALARIEGGMRRKKTAGEVWLPRLIAVGVAVSLACILALLFSVAHLRAEVRELSTAMGVVSAEVTESGEPVKETHSEPTATPAPTPTPAPTATLTPTPTPAPAITKQPTDETKKKGDSSGNVFLVYVNFDPTLEGCRVYWQSETDGEPVELTEAALTGRGLVQTDPEPNGDGTYRLALRATGITVMSEGTYRCVAVLPDGTELKSDWAKLTVETTPAESASPTP